MGAMIRNAGKAYSVFDAAKLVLASGDRFHVKFTVDKNGPQKLYSIPANGSLWLSREEALSQFMHSDGMNEFYRMEQTELEEPKGNFTSVAVCGLSGELLGPASHHSFQTNAHRIHRERYGNMSFEDYRRRIRTDQTPEGVAKWKESQKHGQEWVYITHAVEEGSPTEAESEAQAQAPRFKSRADMEAHFRKTHSEGLIYETHERIVPGNIPKDLLNPGLYAHLRRAVDEARKHLLQTAQLLCVGFEHHGLKIFKRRGGKLWVSRTRPRALNTSMVLSDRASRIVSVVKAQPGILTKDLIEAIAPSEPDAPKAATKAAAAPAAKTDQYAAATAAAAAYSSTSAHNEAENTSEPNAVIASSIESRIRAEEQAEAEAKTKADKTEIGAVAATETESESPESDSASPTSEQPVAEPVDEQAEAGAEAEEPAAAQEETPEVAPAPEPAPSLFAVKTPPMPAAPSPAPHELSTAQLQVLKDLHWLNSEGYLIEYADGVVFPGITDPPPAKPKAKKEPSPRAEGTAEAGASTETASDAENELGPEDATEETIQESDSSVSSEGRSSSAEPESEEEDASHEAEESSPDTAEEPTSTAKSESLSSVEDDTDLDSLLPPTDDEDETPTPVEEGAPDQPEAASTTTSPATADEEAEEEESTLGPEDATDTVILEEDSTVTTSDTDAGHRPPASTPPQDTDSDSSKA